ncbi:hypothetical protein AYI70_g2410 [Smittium culicis]|uniref:Uncharacterized protein n=1 Tax=Smittium culicis TaxID=133412 RepID=A0A1R1XYB1_9FUNG|nr:hypothetical protein AYI70_g4586 [Smittium culicis]OMJ23203.1 hypothetical protein AYI70_g2410 [Smittium culicis]
METTGNSVRFKHGPSWASVFRPIVQPSDIIKKDVNNLVTVSLFKNTTGCEPIKRKSAFLEDILTHFG